MRQPLFALSGANPGALDQFVVFASGADLILAIEDCSRVPPLGPCPNADESFADLTVRVRPLP